MNSKDKLYCPVCKNGIDKSKIIRLYIQNGEFDNDMNDFPKPERIEPQLNDTTPGFVRNNFAYKIVSIFY